MNTDLRLFPESASTMAGQVDALYFFLVAMTAVLTIGIAAFVIVFAVRYRHTAEHVDRMQPPRSMWLEISWLVLPIPILLFIFYWGADLYFVMHRAPEDAMEVSVVGLQWMWKFQHPEGHSEIDELHVPAGRPVRLTMISQDVIHSFYVPAFRIKRDVLPGRYNSIWFQATRPGVYHLFCAEYCGTEHSGMRGRIVVMTPRDYENWLRGPGATEAPEVAGARLFEQLRCDGCHRGGQQQRRCPPLEGLFSRPSTMRTGETVVADENYIRESILRPDARVVAGYDPIMPSYEGQISEEGILQIIAYIRSLGPQPRVDEAPGAAPPAAERQPQPNAPVREAVE